MKGCLITILVLIGLVVLLIIGGAGYVGYQATELASEMEAGYALIENTNTVFPFEAPVDERFDESRFDRYLSVRLGAVSNLESSIHDLELTEEPDGFFDAISTAFGAAKGMLNAFQSVPHELAGELEANQMSYDEYIWFTERVHATLATADRANADPRATAALDRLEESMDSDDGHGKIQRDAIPYATIRHRLERKYRTFEPANLELILAKMDSIAEPKSQVTLDAFLLNAVLNRETDEESPK